MHYACHRADSATFALLDGRSHLWLCGQSMEWVYLIWSATAKCAKIGRSKDIRARLKSLQTANPHTLTVLWYSPCTLGTEAYLHAFFASRRTLGEWFRITLPEFIEDVTPRAQASDTNVIARSIVATAGNRKTKRNRNAAKQQISAPNATRTPYLALMLRAER